MRGLILLMISMAFLACSSNKSKTPSSFIQQKKELYAKDSLVQTLQVINFNKDGLAHQEIFYNKNQTITAIWTYEYHSNGNIKYKYRYKETDQSTQVDTFIYANGLVQETRTLGPFTKNQKEIIRRFNTDGTINNEIDITHLEHDKTVYLIQYHYQDQQLIKKERFYCDAPNELPYIFEDQSNEYWSYSYTNSKNELAITTAKSYLDDSLVQEIQFIENLNSEGFSDKQFLDSDLDIKWQNIEKLQ